VLQIRESFIHIFRNRHDLQLFDISPSPHDASLQMTHASPINSHDGFDNAPIRLEEATYLPSTRRKSRIKRARTPGN
jgi:hypothetical protein